MEMPFSVVSLSHQKAPVAIRELIYLPEQACRKLLVDFRDILGLEEVLLFSTCNRTEVYYRGGRDFSEEIIQLICIENGIDSWREYLPYFRIIREEEAALAYLFEVSMGLHSQVLGDLQIASQVKHAYRWTHEAGMASAYLHRLMHTIFHTNKRVQQETPYRDGAASVSYAAAELAAELCSQFEAPRALVVGLGEMGRDVARNLDPAIFDAIHLMNRSYSKAAKLATETGHTALPLEELPRRIGDYDLIISAVSTQQPLFTPPLFHATLRSQFIIDLGVPRTVDKAVESLPQLVLYNIDDIHARTQEVLRKRQAAIPAVKTIIEEELHTFLEWRTQLSISPIIHRFKETLERIRKEELARFLKNATPSESELLEEATRSMVNKILRLPVLQLKEACRRGDPDGLIDVINELFNLEAVKQQGPHQS